jgi:YVTN family beta-propeller protein
MPADAAGPPASSPWPPGAPDDRRPGRVARLSVAGAAAAVAVAVACGTLLVTGSTAGPGAARGSQQAAHASLPAARRAVRPARGSTPVNTSVGNIKYQVGLHSGVWHIPAPARTGDYHAYVALTGGDSVAEIDVDSDTILADGIKADTAEGIAAAPDGSRIFVAETGQYDVIAVNLSTGKRKHIAVGAYPQQVAVSPGGQTVYATVTGADTGSDGAGKVAVISTADSKVTREITVGDGPRQVVVSRDGTRVYVSTDHGIAVIGTASARVITTIADPAGPQGLAVSPGGSVLYVTNPAASSLWMISTVSGRVIRRVAAGAQPAAIALTPDGRTLYVADTDADCVLAVAAGTGRLIARIPVGGLPGSVAITPDGSQVWVGNILTGNISVIDAATNIVAGTINGGTGTATLNAAPLGIVFVKVR